MIRTAPLLLLLGLALAACAPRMSPPYRDFEERATTVQVDSLGVLTERLTSAARDAGWEIGPPQAPGMVSTQPRRFTHGLWGRTTVELDLVPLDGGFVRVYVRAESKGLLGGRSKVYALTGELRRIILGPVSAALSERRLVPLGTPRERDEDAVR